MLNIRTVLMLFLLLISVGAVYGQMRHFEFINFDDSVPNLSGYNVRAGLNFKPMPFLVLKGEYSYTGIDLQEFHYMGFQVAVAF